MRVRIVILVIVLAIAASLALFGYSLATQTLDVSTGLKFLLVFASLVVSLAKLTKSLGIATRTPEFYLRAYEFLIGDAFRDDKKGRKALGKALKLYNENKFGEAITLLEKLERSSRGYNECKVIGIFIALCYTDWGLLPQAEKRLENLVDTGVENFTIFNNLGFVRSGMKKYEKALDAYEKAVGYADPEDLGTVYVNMARAYLAQDYLAAAEDFALKAIEAAPELHQPACILAMVYSATEDRENYEKYFDLAVSNGQDENELLEIVNKYMERFEIEDNSPNSIS